MISHIRFNSSLSSEYGHWGFEIQLPSIRLRYVNFKNSAADTGSAGPAGSLQLTVGLLLWSVWLAVFFDKEGAENR